MWDMRAEWMRERLSLVGPYSKLPNLGEGGLGVFLDTCFNQAITPTTPRGLAWNATGG